MAKKRKGIKRSVLVGDVKGVDRVIGKGERKEGFAHEDLFFVKGKFKI